MHRGHYSTSMEHEAWPLKSWGAERRHSLCGHGHTAQCKRKFDSELREGCLRSGRVSPCHATQNKEIRSNTPKNVSWVLSRGCWSLQCWKQHHTTYAWTVCSSRKTHSTSSFCKTVGSSISGSTAASGRLATSINFLITLNQHTSDSQAREREVVRDQYEARGRSVRSLPRTDRLVSEYSEPLYEEL